MCSVYALCIVLGDDEGADITLYPASGVFAVIMISDISFQSLMVDKETRFLSTDVESLLLFVLTLL